MCTVHLTAADMAVQRNVQGMAEIRVQVEYIPLATQPHLLHKCFFLTPQKQKATN